MEWVTALETTDRNILRFLSLYADLGSLELWYELGESSNQVERLTREEVLDRLDFLSHKGLWKKFGNHQALNS